MKQNSNLGNQTDVQNFSGLGISPNLLLTLDRLNFKTPTMIQRQAIPIALEGKDLVGVAQTGTGKTFAFGIPMLQRLNQIKGNGLVILPTRELAIQVDESLRKIGGSFGLKTAVLIGGMSMYAQIQAINRGAHIIIATPGRLNDHIQQRTVRLQNVKIVVLDEADRMLDMGFAPQIKTIFQALSSDRQTMLFSATLPPEIMKMATSYMKLPIRIEVAPTGTIADRLTQEIFIIPRNDKSRLVEKLLQKHLGSALIFTKTKHGARKLARSIKDMGHTSAEIHSNRTLAQRRDALQGFKSGKYRVLVATDITSRGIDVEGLELVINFDLPSQTEDYVHRIGRTARAGVSGHAISFVAPDQRRELRNIERLIRKTLPISPIPELPPMRAAQAFVPDNNLQQKKWSSQRSFGNSGQRDYSNSGRRSFETQKRPFRHPQKGNVSGPSRLRNN